MEHGKKGRRIVDSEEFERLVNANKGEMMTYNDIQRIALGFVLETETWPVFMEWCRKNVNTDKCREWLERGPELRYVRDMYIDHRM